MDGQSPARTGTAGALAPGWLLLSDRDAPLSAALPARLAAGLLVIELAWPLPPEVLLDWRDAEGRALALFHHPDSGLSLMWREGGRMVRHILPVQGRSESRLARLFFRWNRAANLWSMDLDDGEERRIGTTCGVAPTGFPGAALAALCRGEGVARRDSAVLWFGVTAGETPPARTPWIGRATPVPTPSGPVAAGLLRAGDWVMTRDAGPLPLRSIRHLEMPSRGSHAAVVLRAPYHARGCDLLVSADQRVVIGGPEAEYLFAEEEVLVAAGALVDGRSAIADNRRATTPCVSLDVGSLQLIDVQGCALMTAHHGTFAQTPITPLRALHDYEALPLMSLLRRMRPSDAA